ncbi:MAG: ribose-5-phosphate isomerase RpiA [Puia sp.]|nr:ribose-5-phosphate isomerase RpiA [Puia sp.]
MEDPVKNVKKLAAVKAIDYIRDGMTLGLGTGSTAYWAIQGIGERVKQGLTVRAIATSVQSDSLAREAGIPIVSFAEIDHLDITIDGADEVDEKLNLIKGGGGALLREKIVASATLFYIIIVDETKLVPRLGKFPLPVEVAPFGWEMTSLQLSKLGCKPVLRSVNDKPFLSDNGHYILDCAFGEIVKPALLHEQVNAITGVMDNGLFINMADVVIAAYKDGSTKLVERVSG